MMVENHTRRFENMTSKKLFLVAFYPLALLSIISVPLQLWVGLILLSKYW